MKPYMYYFVKSTDDKDIYENTTGTSEMRNTI